MRTCKAGGSSFGTLILVLLLAAGLMAAGAQQSTPRKPDGAGGSGGSASGSAKEAGVPYEVFMIRMKEAMSKNVDSDIFIGALESDSVQWLRIAALLGENDWPPAAKAPDFYIAAGNALRNGVSEETLRALIAWAVESRGTPERAGAVLMSVSSLTGVMDTAGISRAAGLIASSRLRVGEFDDLAVLLKRASAAGRSTAELLAAMEAVLGNRSALRNLERRLLP